MHNFEPVPYQEWEWRNQWGYTTTIADFGDDDILVKSITPYNTKLLRQFSSWEDCEQFIKLIEQDRRF